MFKKIGSSTKEKELKKNLEKELRIQENEALDKSMQVVDEETEDRIQEILKNSPINQFLNDPGVTDINFDGVKLRIQHNIFGSKIVDDVDEGEIRKLAKKIADEKKKTFNDSNPILDTEFGFIRVSAVHTAASPEGTTLSLRISRPRLAVSSISEMTYNNNQEIANLLDVLIKAESNIIIAGRTGSGKTECQKMLVGSIPDDKVIALIEDTRDSHIKALYPNKFVYSWQTLLSDEREKKLMMSDLVKVALRNNPDWVIISETRGAEAADILDSVKTDHSIITTLHAKGAMNIPARLVPMVRQTPAYSVMSDLMVGKEIVEFLRFGIYMRYDIVDGKIVRRIKEIVEYTDYTKEGVKGTYLYRHTNEFDEKTGEYQPKEIFNPLSKTSIDVLKDKQLYHLLPERFKREGE